MNTRRPVDPAGMLDESSRLLLESMAAQPGADASAMGAGADSLRRRLMQRAARSVCAANAFHTVRGPRQWVIDADMRWRWLYQAQPGRALRAGEPLRVRQVELAAGARLELPLEQHGVRLEWLVMAGDVHIDGMPLLVRDYHVMVASRRSVGLRSKGGARLYLREAEQASEPCVPHTVRDRQAPWLAHAPGIERRVLWQCGSESALLYRVQPGVEVPSHGHGHDEECLMVEGDVFVDDILLRAGEYQLAPAGTHHEGVSSDTGGILYAHGDIDLAVR